MAPRKAKQQSSQLQLRSPKSLLLMLLTMVIALFGITPSLTDAATCGQPQNVKLTKPMVSFLVNRIQKRFSDISTNDTEGKRYSPLVPGCIRLGFHSCAAKRCSSYVDLSNPSNNGLQPIVAIVDALRSAIVQQYPSAYSGLSKADFYALCAIAAVEVATNYTGSIVFRYGRPDHCPGDSVADLGVELPPRSIGTADTFAYFRRVFGFNENETVAIMGAHSLGVLHELSTLRPLKRWTNNRPDTYSNEYFVQLNRTDWQLVNSSYSGVPYRQFEWQNQPQPVPKRFLLNSDVGLARQIDVVNITTGQATCTTYSGCPAYRTAALVRQFAADYRYALTSFLSAFRKMLENGLTKSLRDVVN